MHILIATTQVPFIRGGAELHAEGLGGALRAAGHQAEIVAIPFKWYPPARIVSHMAACRLLDLSEFGADRVDMVIGLKFPAYYVQHPNKVLWILHQHRQAYELWEHDMGDLHLEPDGEEVRDAVRRADRSIIPEARAVYANSHTVAARLKRFCDLDATPLYHPPHNAEYYYCGEAGDYLLLASRVSRWKRQSLVIEALAHTRGEVRVRFLGGADHAEYLRELQEEARRLKVAGRVEWLGAVSDEEKRRQYAHALGVVFPPVDEDYGYITLEAMLSCKPVITCADSGGPLEFVRAGETGLVAEPSPEALAAAMDALWTGREAAARMGERGRQLYDGLGISWHRVIETLLS